MLETKWEQQQQLDLNNCKNNPEPDLRLHHAPAARVGDAVPGPGELDSELRSVRDVVEDYKKR